MKPFCVIGFLRLSLYNNMLALVVVEKLFAVHGLSAFLPLDNVIPT